MFDPAQDSEAEIARLKRRLERERAIRLQAEAIAECGLRELYERQKRLELLEYIAAAANQTNSAKAVLQLAVEQICRFANWSLAHALVTEGSVLRSASTWHIADPSRISIFRTVTSTYEFGPGEGLPGTVLQSAQPVWIEDLANHDNFPRLRFAKRAGLKSGAAFPVLSGKDVLAVVEFYSTETRRRDETLIELMAQAGLQLGRAIERHQAHEQLERQTKELAVAHDEAKAADKAKSAFLANMSHELRTPLNAIIGFSDLMIEGIYGRLNEKYAGYMKDIRASGMHLKDILNDILDLSKIDAGTMELQAQPVSLEEIGESCRRIMAPLAEKAGVELRFNIARDLPSFQLDPTRFRQTLINIVSNAVKFTPPGGKVVVRASRDDQECIVSVADTGIGMTDDGVSLALQPFRQVDSALNRRFEGTGLGLPLSKALMELHGGMLTIASEPGNGTVVNLHLPMNLRAAAA